MIPNTIPLIDVFAGPGGLNEGFSRLGEAKGAPRFSTIASFEMDPVACKTLTLRGAYRNLLRSGTLPSTYYQFIRGEISESEFRSDAGVESAWKAASAHVHEVELGPDSRAQSDELIRAALSDAGALGPDSEWALIGGPPCQAYSLAGRSRRANDEDFEKDKKHFLYEEYLRILRTFAPPVFVMENVKGLLSSTNGGARMFDRILKDLRAPGGVHTYDVYSVVVGGKDPQDLDAVDFVVKSEEYGVPQKRHRVILLGIRVGAMRERVRPALLTPAPAPVSVKSVLEGMPRIRSGISRGGTDDIEAWLGLRAEVANQEGLPAPKGDRSLTRGGRAMKREGSPESVLGEWLIDSNLEHVIQHESRSHMPADLKRYWFAANKARKDGHSPKLRDFPESLLPNHKNAASESRPFEDRFRVQVANRPSTTVVSHISKDGHYYIHHDASQMRSLTVREAARLQTFPDNYFFMGNRTQQFHQVGNAVPPLLAHQIAAVVAKLFER